MKRDLCVPKEICIYQKKPPHETYRLPTHVCRTRVTKKKHLCIPEEEMVCEKKPVCTKKRHVYTKRDPHKRPTDFQQMFVALV